MAVYEEADDGRIKTTWRRFENAWELCYTKTCLKALVLVIPTVG